MVFKKTHWAASLIKFQISILLFFLCFTKAFSQCNAVLIDSLSIALKTEARPQEILELKKSLGTANTECGYYVKGLGYYIGSFELAEKLHDTTSLCVLNNNIAVIYHETGKENLTLEYALKAVYFGERQPKKNVLADAYNTLGNYYYYAYQDSLALKFFSLSLQSRLLTGDKVDIALSYNNIGTVYYETGEKEKGIELSKKALAIRQSLKDPESISSSYEAIGEMYLHMNKLDSALSYFNKYKDQPIKNKSLYIIKSFYESYADLCHRLNMHDSSFLYQKLFIKMNDSILNTKSSAQFAEMQTKYETEKKEAQLKINALDMDKLKQKSFYTTITFSIALLFVILISWLLYYRYKIKQKLELEAEMRNQETLRYKAVIESLEKERGRIAGELHDNTGALISFIITKTDWVINNPQNSGEGLSQIKSSAQEVITSLRETLWTLNNKTITNLDLIDKLKLYIKKHLLSDCKISEASELEVILPNDVVLALYRCVQEIINNINKHSKASSVTVHFITNVITKFGIVITDNGIGFEDELKEDNYGIRNLKIRMKQIQAELIIESKLNKGTKIEISYN